MVLNMSKIRNKLSKRKINISEKLLEALESIQLPEDIVEQIISIILFAQESKTSKTSKTSTTSKIIVPAKIVLSPEEILHNSFNRLDGLNEHMEELKTRVDVINFELQKITFSGESNSIGV
jgi:hypothetical protein